MTERLGMTPFLDQSLATLSQGQRQRMALVRALRKPFELLMLDEPFSHLDEGNQLNACSLIEEVVRGNQAGLSYLHLDPPRPSHLIKGSSCERFIQPVHPAGKPQVTGPRRELWVASLGCLLGTTVLLLTMQLYQDANDYLNQNEGPKNYFTLNKKIEGGALANLGKKDETFTPEELLAIRQAEGVRRLGGFTRNQFPVTVYIWPAGTVGLWSRGQGRFVLRIDSGRISRFHSSRMAVGRKLIPSTHHGSQVLP